MSFDRVRSQTCILSGRWLLDVYFVVESRLQPLDLSLFFLMIEGVYVQEKKKGVSRCARGYNFEILRYLISS